jgi:TusA-related sulfurtransferase
MSKSIGPVVVLQTLNDPVLQILPEVDWSADAVVDISGDVCPMTFVRTRLALDKMSVGQILKVTLRGEEPRRNVPRSVLELGHDIRGEYIDHAGITTLLIVKR